MKKLIQTVGAAAIAISLLGATTAPAMADHLLYGYAGYGNYGDGSGSLERHGNAYYYNGYRGYRSHRPGYIRHHGRWFPIEAFPAGLVAHHHHRHHHHEHHHHVHHHHFHYDE